MKTLSLSLLAAAILAMTAGMAQKSHSPYGDRQGVLHARVIAARIPAFLNSVTERQAVTSDLPSASLPLGISLNNGNGRPWIANAPNGAGGLGTITVLDPQGYPLGGAPNMVAGGVFAGDMTNRN